MGYFIDRRKRKARGWERDRIRRQRWHGAVGKSKADEERWREREGGRESSNVTVSVVHAASCLATSEKPASDKQGLWHATPSTRNGIGWYRRGRRWRVVIIDTGCLNAGSIDTPISHYYAHDIMRQGVTSLLAYTRSSPMDKPLSFEF